ncbi:MAG: hypothetical protein NTY48_03115, partial [Candidatus Diapherotrites archaeon]|nr:hypothetical protein [Candidatus Diapherotrites archaeon]
NRKLDPACLLAEPTSVTLSMIGLPGATDATSIDFTNKCDETLNLTKKQQKVNLSSGIEVASDVQLSIQPGETKQVTVSATNYFERASVREEVQTFSLVYDSNSLKKTISVIVKTTNPTFALSYPPQLTLWLAQSNLTQKAVAAEPMFISNISSFPVDNISFSVNSSYFQQANVRLTVEPSGNVSLLPGQSIVPPKVVFAQANSKISEPARATIEISGKMGQLANRTGQLDNYNYYNQYNNYPSASNSGTAGFVNNSGITGTTYTSGYGTTGYGTSGNATGYSNTYGNGNGLNGSTSYNNGYNGYYSNGYNSNNYSSPTYGYSGSLYNNGYNGYNGNSGYNSYNGGSMYGGYGGLANYAPASSAYYNNTLRILGQIDVSVFYSGYNCLKARLLTEGEGFYFPIEGAQTAKMITVTNTCAEPVRILGASSASEAKMPQMFGVSPMMKSVMLFLPQVSITPGQAVNLSLSVMTAIPNMNVKTYQVIVNAVSEISQTQMVSQPFGISLYAGTEIGAEHVKGTKINATICKDPSTPKAETKKEQITAPKIVSGPSCNQGYCDAKDAAKYLASAIRAQISKAQAKGYGTQASEDVMGCMSTGACTFDELGIPVEPIDLYLQNDKITTEILERELNGKEYEGANTTPFRETPMSTGFTVLSESIDIAFLKPIAMTGYDRKVYLDRELEGCGYYRVRISGAFKATTQGLETMTPVIAVKVMPINGLPKLITKECLPSMNNVLNFNPLDLGLDEGTDYGTWLTTVTTDPSFELIAKEIAQKRYKSDKRVTSTGIGNKVVLKQGALQGTLAQMCMTGNDRKTIEVTIDNSVSRSNDKSTKDKFTTAIVQMVSNVLNGAFGDNCFVKTGDSYPCINLTDLTKEGTRKISLVSPTLLFASKDGGCVTGTVYSNVPGEQLQFVIEPKTNQANGKNFTGVSRITISTDDKIKKPIASAPPLTSLVQTPTNLTSTSQPIQPPSIASPSQSSPPGANLGTSSARTSPQDSTTKSPSTGAFTTLQPQTVGTSAIAIQSGTISTAPPLTIFGTNPLVEEVKVLNILPGNQQGSEKDNWIKLIENKTSTDYKYYRNIKICAMPSTQEAGDKLPLTAYINANGSQFDIALINSLANETNAGERQTITINI